MRIVGGEFRGRKIATPAGRETRPTSERTREAVFDKLAHGPVGDFAGLRVLDLFAGSGALGLEALSRGAAYALFVEDGLEARGALRTNIETLGLMGRTRIFKRDATRLGARPGNVPDGFGLVFLDPPYGRDLVPAAVASARAGGWIAPGALVVAEEKARTDLLVPDGFEELDRRTYGDSQVAFWQAP